MKELNLCPDAYILTTLLCNLAKAGNIDAIRATVKENSEIPLMDKHFMQIIYELAINGHNNHIGQIIGEYIQKNRNYNNDAVNIIHSLINAGEDEVAFEIFKTMSPTSWTGNNGIFIIAHMMKADRPIQKAIEIAKRLDMLNSNSAARTAVLYHLLKKGANVSAFQVLKNLYESGEILRENYFWPIMCSEAKKGNDQVLQVLSQMRDDLHILPSSTTIRDYVVPNLKVSDPYELINILEHSGISRAKNILAVVYKCITDNNLKAAYDIAQENNFYYASGMLRKALVNAFVETNDMESYTKLIQIIYQSEKNLGKKYSKQEDSREDDVFGEFVFDTISHLKNHGNYDEYLEKLLIEFKEKRMILSHRQFRIIQTQHGASLSNRNLKLLQELQYVTEAAENKPGVANIKNRILLNSDASDARISKLSLLHQHLKYNDLLKADELFNTLVDNKHHISNNLAATLIYKHALANNHQRALQLYTDIKAQQNAFRLSGLQAVTLASALIASESGYNAARVILRENHLAAVPSDSNSYHNIKAICQKMLNLLEYRNDFMQLEQFLNDLVDNKFVRIDNSLLKPLIKVSIKNGNVEQAIKLFKNSAIKYRKTLCQDELFCALIEMSDVTKLEQVTQLCISINGEAATLYSLAFAFIASKRPVQATTILQNVIGKDFWPVMQLTENYGTNESFLLDLLDITKDMDFPKRQTIYNNLLQIYRKSNSPNAIVDLYNKHCSDKLEPSLQFLHAIKTYLESVKHPVPFDISTKIAGTDSPITDDLHLEQLIGSGELDTASKLILEKLEKKESILRNVFKFHLSKVAASGNMSFFEAARAKLGFEEQRELNFWKFYCKAVVNAGKANEFLLTLMQCLDDDNTRNDRKQLTLQIPFEMFALLEANPELINECK